MLTKTKKYFLKTFLKHYGYEVLIEDKKKKEEEDPLLYTVAVTVMIFKPKVAIFEPKLKPLDGHKVTQDHWFQRTTETKLQY